LILDTSAVVAVVFREPEEHDFLHKIGTAAIVGIGAPTLAETAIVLAARLGQEGARVLSLMVQRAGIVVVPFDSAHSQLAAEAWLRYGKGRHPAGLNFGDCLAYATARVAGRPLLCKGDDFPKTDLVLAG
jgi:ribonuclease VapC